MAKPKRKPGQVEPKAKKPARGPAPEDIARAAVAHRAEPTPSGKVIMTVRLFLTRETAERLTAQAIREARSLEAVIGEILEAAEPN